MMCKNIFVCDQEVDIYDLNKVFSALGGYRVDPTKEIIQFPGWISALDPIVHIKATPSAGLKQANEIAYRCNARFGQAPR